jgi:hypothetical protein
MIKEGLSSLEAYMEIWIHISRTNSALDAMQRKIDDKW